MDVVGFWLSAAGAAGGLGAAIWLLVGFDPASPRYEGTWDNLSDIVPNLLRDQRKVAALLVISATLQLLGVALRGLD